MSKPASRLGRGLSSIVRPHALEIGRAAAGETAEGNQLRAIPISAVQPNPHQPRVAFDEVTLHELARSISAHGVLQPIIVQTLSGGYYQLIAGERRLRGAQLAGLKTIPALVRDATEAQSLEIALIENLQREDLGPLERAAGYRQYLDAVGVSVDDLADRVGESRANVSNYLRLLNLREEIREMIGRKELGMGQARAIAGLEDPERQLAIARLAARRNLAVRQVEALARGVDRAKAREERHSAVASRHLADVGEAMARALGLEVRLIPGRQKNSGRVVIYYKNLDGFDRIANKVCGRAALEES